MALPAMMDDGSNEKKTSVEYIMRNGLLPKFSLLWLWLCGGSVPYVVCAFKFDITNPYFSGCLRQFSNITNFTKQRVCNSEDSPEVLEHGGLCRIPDPALQRLEVRIETGNWESVLIGSWVAEIILSELLDVPVTIEGMEPGIRRSFYDPTMTIDPGTISNNFESLHVPTTMTHGACDCRTITQQNNLKEPEDYQGCAHYTPEAWSFVTLFQERINRGEIEAPLAGGLLGQEAWFVTKFTTQKDPTLASYHGYVGEENREKLAETFLRPTTWHQYCSEVSLNNCTIPDPVAQRAPVGSQEEDRMFFPNQYTGHFRKTDLNDCQTNPQTCTGHATNYPCGWTSSMEANIYHMNMALDCNGPNGEPMPYSYQQILDMWDAANATQSNLLGVWWTPDPLYNKWLGTNSEMQRVLLKPTTQLRLNHQPTNECPAPGVEHNITERIGTSPLAACDFPPIILKKIITGCLYEASESSRLPPALHSPAYETLRRIEITDGQINEMLDLWMSDNNTPQDAVCTWIATNIESIKSTALPTGFPRILQPREDSTIRNCLFGIGLVATVLVCGTSIAVYYKRATPAIRLAQPNFLALILSGSLLISIGSMLTSAPEISNATCVSAIWFINVGYSMALVPLYSKVASINRVLQAGAKMKRVSVSPRRLYGPVLGIGALIVVYLTIWTILDPPKKQVDLELTETTTDQGEYVVITSFFCLAGGLWWEYIAVGWNAVLLLAGSVLAFQNKSNSGAFNESRTLTILIYSNFVFVCLRLATYLLSGSIDGTLLDQIRSLIYSVDTIATIAIYFLPKLLAKSTNAANSNRLPVTHESDDGDSNFSLVSGGRSRISGLNDPREAKKAPEKEASVENTGEMTSGGTDASSSSLNKAKTKDQDPESDKDGRNVECPNCGHKWKND